MAAAVNCFGERAVAGKRVSRSKAVCETRFGVPIARLVDQVMSPLDGNDAHKPVPVAVELHRVLDARGQAGHTGPIHAGPFIDDDLRAGR